MTTIFALSSGRPPSGVAVLRISGPAAVAALAALTTVSLPPARTMAVRRLLAPDGSLLDRALVVHFPGPHSVTGEDVVELHLHGGTAVVAAVVAALTNLGLIPAAAGAFTRRAFDNGKLDLGQVEALGDLIAAETEGQRRAALEQTGGRLAAVVDGWRATLLHVRAELEATLDFAEEDDIAATLSPASIAELAALLSALHNAAADGRRGALIRHGVTVALVGPVNAGKSTLLNALARRDAAMVSDVPGTTRDVIEVRLALGGLLVTLVDTAGRRDTADPLEIEGIRRGVERAAAADVVVDVGPEPATGAITVATKCDLDGRQPGWHDGTFHLSAVTGAGMAEFERFLGEWVATLVRPGEPPLIAHARQTAAINRAAAAVATALRASDPVLIADELRDATAALAALIGRITSEQLLNEIFGRFCIGK